MDRVYRQMKHQLSGLENILQEYGAEKSSAMKSVLNMCRNIDFIEQINQMYTYVQLPLKMEQRQANGELYVFTNKRSLAKRRGLSVRSCIWIWRTSGRWMCMWQCRKTV